MFGDLTATEIALASLAVSALTLVWSVWWSVHVWRASRKTRVVIDPRVVTSSIGDGYAAGIEVQNHSEHEITVKGAGFEVQKKGGKPITLPRELPARIAPRDSHLSAEALVDIEKAGIDPEKPVTAWALLGDGTQVTKRVKRLGSRADADAAKADTTVVALQPDPRAGMRPAWPPD